MAQQNQQPRLDGFLRIPHEGDEIEKPVRKVKTKVEGSSGTDITAGILNEDYLNTLTGTEKADKYDKMRRSDTKIKMCINAVKNPVRRAEFQIEPVDDSDEEQRIARFAQFALFESHGQPWQKFLNEILSCIDFGYSLFERTHRVMKAHPEFGDKIVYQGIKFRSQRTIEFWHLDFQTGELKAVEQFAFGDAQSNAVMDARFLTHFSIDQEGDNFEGISLLRPALGPWMRKQTYLKLEAIGMEKYAVPIPKLKIPAGEENSEATDAAVDNLKKYISHQNNYITHTKDYDVELFRTDFDADKIRNSIKEENAEIVQGFLANFLELGQGGNSGAYALGKDLSDFFLSGVEYIGDIVCEQLQRTAIKEIIDLNFGERQRYPQLKCSGISDKIGEEFGTLLKDLQAGRYITPDDRLEENLRARIGLPKRDAETSRDSQAGAPGSGDDGTAPESENKQEGPQMSEPLQFAEKPKTAAGLITQKQKELLAIMREELDAVGKRLVSDIMGSYGELPDSKKLQALNDKDVRGTRAYQRRLERFLRDTAAEATEMARGEVPGKEDVKFAEGDIHFAEDEDIPKKSRKMIKEQADQLSKTQTEDVKKAVVFNFMHREEKLGDEKRLESDLNRTVEDQVKSASVTAAAGNEAAFAVNFARQSFFLDPKVVKDIAVFKFKNDDPVTPICEDLDGRVFSPDDPRAREFFPPLHWNCDSYVVPVPKSAGRVPAVSDRGLEPSDPKLKKFIQFNENFTAKRLTKT